MTNVAGATGRRNWWTIGLWVAQILLAVAFGGAGFMKLTTPPATLVGMMGHWVEVVPSWLVLFIGTMEVLGALGMILPAATRILPMLTPAAAVGFAIIQVLAIGVHASTSETAKTLPLNLVLLALALLVAWGRSRKAPIFPR